MVESSSHGVARILPKSQCSALPSCRVQFLDTQITGAVFMIQRTLGRVPLSGAHTPEAERASGDLESLTTHGGIVADTMGLGKTYLALLFINFTVFSESPGTYWFGNQSSIRQQPITISTGRRKTLQRSTRTLGRRGTDFSQKTTRSTRTFEDKSASTEMAADAGKVFRFIQRCGRRGPLGILHFTACRTPTI